MAEELGRNATLYVSVSGSSYTKLAEIKDLSTSLTNEQNDATSRDDSGYKVRLNGDQEISIDAECNYDPSDAGQLIVLNAAKARTTIYAKYRKQGDGAGLPERTCQINVESEEDDAPVSDIHSVSFSLVSTGTITDSTQ